MEDRKPPDEPIDMSAPPLAIEIQIGEIVLTLIHTPEYNMTIETTATELGLSAKIIDLSASDDGGPITLPPHSTPEIQGD